MKVIWAYLLRNINLNSTLAWET